MNLSYIMICYNRPCGGEPEHARHPEDPLLRHLGPRRHLGIITTIIITTTSIYHYYYYYYYYYYYHYYCCY